MPIAERTKYVVEDNVTCRAQRAEMDAAELLSVASGVLSGGASLCKLSYMNLRIPRPITNIIHHPKSERTRCKSAACPNSSAPCS
jgi:hypothetical protein